MNHKRTIYQCSQPVADGVVLCSNLRNRSHLLLTEKAHSLYSGTDEMLGKLASEFPQIYERLVKGGFLVDKNLDEAEDYWESVDLERKDPSFFQIIVNPTLDCNLACWYCYETKVAGSKISAETEDAICRLIEHHYAEAPYRLLKLSFFGGEPFKCPATIRRLAEFARGFCESKGLELLLDFTTNGTLLTASMLDFLADYSCMFQITLDGGSERHNKVKFSPEKNFDTFGTTIRNIHRIQERITDCSVSVRINFDKETLKDFDEIFDAISDLDRRRTKIIVKKVWQVDADGISNDYVDCVIDKLLDADFVVDYYSQGGVCFADRDHQVTVNYDGNVFRCTTISDFDDKNALGRLNSDGSVCWDENKTLYLRDKRFPERCRDCRMLPSCGGSCRLKAFSEADDSCFLDDIHMTVEQYALLQFRFEITKHRLYVPEQI